MRGGGLRGRMVRRNTGILMLLSRLYCIPWFIPPGIHTLLVLYPLVHTWLVLCTLVHTPGFIASAVSLMMMPAASGIFVGVAATTLTLGSLGFSRGGFSVNHMDIGEYLDLAFAVYLWFPKVRVAGSSICPSVAVNSILRELTPMPLLIL